MRRILLLAFLPILPVALAGCEQLGIDDPVKVAEKREAEGRAVGSGCRHVGMALQECYDRNRKESKAAIFAGWREMDGYMRENKIDTVKADDGGEEEAAPRDAGKSAEKPDAGGTQGTEKSAAAGARKTAGRVGAQQPRQT